MNGPSYRFRLERVRALRERREEQAKQDFAAALVAREHAREERDKLTQRIVAAHQAQLAAAAGELAQHQSYVERLERTQELATQELARHEAELTRRRAALTRASQDRESLERLKERGLAEHNREQARVEQSMLDEIAGNSHWRQAA
jgi:flagellar FliJ protein